MVMRLSDKIKVYKNFQTTFKSNTTEFFDEGLGKLIKKRPATR